ncbi:hypothetical protein HHI36_008529 [Cryptolaemus montrouzieri]|uniref:Major facilitator superfamily (MFS) profile domain-containing protein n=1 Tax=Cryptolaemus montrouzieri TaxID=559131 RepID=A0ABD2MST0_9CUCU
MQYLEAFRGFLNNCDYLSILFCFGLPSGVFNSVGLLANEMYLHYFPDNENNIGILVLISIVSGGIFASIFSGYILDKTHKFKLIYIIGPSLLLFSR